MRKLKLALMTGVLATGIVGGTAVAASAYTPPPDCQGSTWVCIYKNANYDSRLGYRTVPFALQNMSTGTGGAANELSSYANTSTSNAAWYDKINGAGTCYNMGARTKVDEYGVFDRDRAESWKSGSC